MRPDERLIRELDRKARARFTYKEDRGADTWRSFADTVMADKAWIGDCDDLASTVLDLITRVHPDALDECYRVMVSTTGSERVDHMVAAVRDDQDRVWIVGDTFGPAYLATRCNHRIIQSAKLSEGTTWRRGPSDLL